MMKIIIYLVFLISVAMAAAGVVLSTRLRHRNGGELFSSMLYFQVFIYTFGFYGVWGQALIRAYLSDYIREELMTRISDIAMLLGLPFLVFAWLMLLRFFMQLSGRKTGNRFYTLFLLVNFLLIILTGYFTAKTDEAKPFTLLRIYFIAMNFIYSLAAFFLISGKKTNKTSIHDFDRKMIAASTLIIFSLQSIALVFYNDNVYTGIIFIFVFFAGNIFLPVYFSYGTLAAGIPGEGTENLTFENFCRKFDVSPREKDIIREICNGLSNKEISDKLFITLQTVKDHTHRIYIKIGVRSRVQLITLVREVIKA